jgi:hypothetical protein
MGVELDRLAADTTFIIPPSDDECDLASLPTLVNTFVVPVPEGNTFFVVNRSRKE